MIQAQELIERAWFASLIAPEADRAGRTKQLQRALEVFAPVLRPLALELELCWREEDTGLSSRTVEPDPAIVILVAGELPAGVSLVSTVAAPPAPQHVAALDGKIDLSRPAPAPNLHLDWRSIRTIATGVHTSDAVESFSLSPLGRTVRAYEAGWFAGPIGEIGLERRPPAELIFDAEFEVVLTVNVHWSGWRQVGSLERAAFDAAVATLEREGWRLRG